MSKQDPITETANKLLHTPPGRNFNYELEWLLAALEREDKLLEEIEKKHGQTER